MTRSPRASAPCASGRTRNALCAAAIPPYATSPKATKLNRRLNRTMRSSNEFARAREPVSQQEVHFEIFSRKGSKGGWTMFDVTSDRAGALRLAEGLMADGQATGVKVVKETYNTETGDYLTLKIFEDGQNKLKSSPSQEDVPHALP